MLWILEETNTNEMKWPKIDPCGYNKSLYYKGEIGNQL